jgi:hypothetical protein
MLRSIDARNTCRIQLRIFVGRQLCFNQTNRIDTKAPNKLLARMSTTDHTGGEKQKFVRKVTGVKTGCAERSLQHGTRAYTSLTTTCDNLAHFKSH